jgi:hypothetical protein
MSPLFTYNGKLLTVQGKLASGPNCCCGCPQPESEVVVDPENFGWTKPPTKAARSITATFTFEDSAGPGPNGCGTAAGILPQSGKATCSFFLSENTQVTLDVTGDVEGQTPGFDYGWIVITGPGVPPTKLDEFAGPFARNISSHVIIGSSASGNGCSMFNKNDQVQMNIGPGKYIVTFEVNTFDNAYHQNMVHNFSVTW